MNRSRTWWSGAARLALVCMVGLSACGQSSMDAREARNRHMRRALAAKEAQDVDGAISWCLKALERRPDLGLAHRELALMYDNFREEYDLALYHYRRYLELRPDSPNREAVEDLIRHCRVSIARQVTSSPEEWRRDLDARTERIRALEREVAALREAAGESAGVLSLPAARPPSAVDPPVLEPGQLTHVVQAGETLGTISIRYFGTPAQWNRIFEANRDRMSNANNLRVGTTLLIPKP